jgi:hypothetical protein
LADDVLIASSGRATSISFLRVLMMVTGEGIG